MSRFFINTDQIQTYLEEVIAITFQRNTVGNLSTRQTSHTNDFRLPPTQANLKALGSPELIQSADRPEYSPISGSIISKSGVPVMSNGRFTIKSITQDILLQGFSGYRQLSELIKGKSLWDLSNIAQWDHELRFGNVVGSWDNTEGHIYGMFQDGTLLDGTDNTLLKPFDLMLPNYYVHTIIEEILNDAGFEVDRTTGLFANPFFLSVVLPFSKDKLVLSERLYPNINLETGEVQTFTQRHPRTEAAGVKLIGILDFNGEEVVIGGGARQIIDIQASITVDGIGATFISPPGITDANFQSGNQLALIDQDNNIIAASSIIVGPGEYSLSVDDYDLLSTTSLRLAFMGQFFNQEITITISKATVDTSSEVEALAEGVMIGAEMVLPEDIKQDQFLKALMVMFSVIPVEEGGRVTFEFWDSLLDNLDKAINLSQFLLKPDNAPPKQWYREKQTVLGDYGQNNILEYKEDNDKQVQFRARRGNILCTDETLPPEKILYTFPFAASGRFETNSGIYMMDARSAVEDTESSGFLFDGNIEQRIGYIKRENVGMRVGSVFPTQNTSVPFVNFVNPDSPQNLNPLSLIANYHEVQRLVLQDPLLLICEMDLPARVFHEIDVNSNYPVWIDKFGGYFYVNKIPNFVEGTVTQIELVKLL